ncbi:synaptonemal complex central element protein 2-like [Babylonia areolata]|uniref:synaptonemal complex central element protein 2-like n=1 Tax=Babylonia areolata TaxID=304850 RepID=UPI003FD05436
MASKSVDDAEGKESRVADSAAVLSERAQQLVSGLNDKRKQDTNMLAELKATLLSQVENIYNAVEQHMYNTYEKQGKMFNETVHELFACLERVATLETELAQFKQDLTSFCQEMD